MEKYRPVAEKSIGNQKSHGKHKVHPEILAQEAHVKGEFSSRVMDEFFDEVNGEVLCDLFNAWLHTEPHETKTREFLYSTAMALGSVREKLIQKETYGRNIPTLNEMGKDFNE